MRAPSTGKTLLAPGEKTIFTADLPILDQQLVVELTHGTKAIFLLARVDYLDVFDRARRIRMRASSVGVTKVAVDGGIQLEWYGEDNDLT